MRYEGFLRSTHAHGSSESSRSCRGAAQARALAKKSRGRVLVARHVAVVLREVSIEPLNWRDTQAAPLDFNQQRLRTRLCCISHKAIASAARIGGDVHADVLIGATKSLVRQAGQVGHIKKTLCRAANARIENEQARDPDVGGIKAACRIIPAILAVIAAVNALRRFSFLQAQRLSHERKTKLEVDTCDFRPVELVWRLRSGTIATFSRCRQPPLRR